MWNHFHLSYRSLRMRMKLLSAIQDACMRVIRWCTLCCSFQRDDPVKFDFASVHSCAGKGLTSWHLFVMFNCVFVTFPCGILGQVWYLIVSIPDHAVFLTLLSGWNLLQLSQIWVGNQLGPFSLSHSSFPSPSLWEESKHDLNSIDWDFTPKLNQSNQMPLYS